jgi:valyl-tRNA synthetase
MSAEEISKKGEYMIPKEKPQKERYDFSSREPYWQKFWEKEKTYEFDPNLDRPLYTIDTPPPTISGSLHLGHIFSYTQTEVISRYKRMAGFNVRYPFGFDDNGLPTERLVEKELGVKARSMSLDEFRNDCMDVVKKYAGEFRSLWQSVGLSVDWRLDFSTISDEVRHLSQQNFLNLYEKGAIYRKEAPSLYCPECRTSIAQAEVEDKERPSVFYDLLFSMESGDKITIATTRPELLPACVAVLVNPSDKRYKDLVGKTATSPLGNAVKIIADDLVSLEKGSGAVMCCTFGDETDLQWVRKYNLPTRVIIDEFGKIKDIKNAPYLKGLTIFQAREEIIKRLRKDGQIAGEKEINHSVGTHERCGTPVEIIPRTQWFVKILDKKDALIKMGEKIKWHPPYMQKRYENWVTNLKWDWCISRERFFGIPIPAYICNNCESVILPKASELPLDPREKKYEQACPHCNGTSVKPETVVLDTWFTSALTPDINNQHDLNGKIKGKILPMSLRPQAHDIIRTWAVYTILMSLYNHEDIPWSEVMISGHVLAKQGEKISKKTGGGKYKPQELINEHSADAIRYAMCQAALGKDAFYDEAQVANGKKLVTKLYNSGKFVLANLTDFDRTTKIEEKNLNATDRWILQRMRETAHSMGKEFEEYEFSKALAEFEKFFWNDFTDNYMELVKGRLYSENKTSVERKSAQFTLQEVYLGVLKMISPFLPHITEEMYHSEYTQTGEKLFEGSLKSNSENGYFYAVEKVKSIHSTQWDFLKGESDEQITAGSALMIKVITDIRRNKTERSVNRSPVTLQRIVLRCSNKTQIDNLRDFVIDITSIGKSQEVILALTDDKKDYKADLEIKV